MQESPKKQQDYEEDVLQIVLNESRDLRNQQLNQLFLNSDHFWNTINFLMILLGIYISSFIFLCDNGKLNFSLDLIITCPLIFSVLFVVIAIVLCLYSTFPADMFKIPLPNSIYELCRKDKETVLDSLIKTYLIGYRDIMVKVKERNSLRKELIIVAVASIIEFAFFASTFIFKNEITLIIVISVIFFLLFEVFLVYFLENENKDIDVLKEEINS